MSLSKNNVHFPNRNFEPIVTLNVVDYSSNLHLPRPREYHFTSVNQCLLTMLHIFYPLNENLKCSAPPSSITCIISGFSCTPSTLDENGSHQTKSKMEAMFIPARPMTQEDIDAATTNIVFGTQYVPFTQEFQYLGSRMTTDLKDVTNINNRLRQAKGQAAALGTFFHSTANTWSKRLIFLAIPVNTALYGAESWTLNVELHRRISSFYHTTICLNHQNQHAPCCGISDQE